MGRVDDQDALQARFERNAPSVDTRRDWVEVRSRMHEHDRRPAGRRLRLLAVACSVLVLVAAITVAVSRRSPTWETGPDHHHRRRDHLRVLGHDDEDRHGSRAGHIVQTCPTHG